MMFLVKRKIGNNQYLATGHGKWLRLQTERELFEDVEYVSLDEHTNTLTIANFPLISLNFIGLFDSEHSALA